MVVIATDLHTGRQRPEAYEIPATFTDDAGGEHNIVMVFRNGEPSQAEIDAMVAFHIARIEAVVEAVVEEVEIEPEL